MSLRNLNRHLITFKNNVFIIKSYVNKMYVKIIRKQYLRDIWPGVQKEGAWNY